MMTTTITDGNPQLQQQQRQATKPSLSKRQRRAAGPNPTNTWQQQPRIKSAGARARAYISYAGLADDDAANKKKSSSSTSNGSSRSLDLLDPQLDLHSPEVKFGRLLGGTDQRSRHAAVKMLREYLRARSDMTSGGVGLSELDLLKLWKGMWYTLYMADKVPVQDKLSKILAELMWCLAGTEEEDEYAGQVYLQMDEGTDVGEEEEEDDDDGDDDKEGMVDGMYLDGGVFEDDEGDTMQIIEMDENSDNEEDGDGMEEEEEEEDSEEQRIKDMNEMHCRGAHLVSLYISTFLRTVRREWGNVDKHRVDKFYTAVRFMIREAYKYMSKRHWNVGIIALFNEVLYTEGLSFETPGLTNGLRYHLIDICVNELAVVNAESELPLTEATFLDVLEPFFVLAQKAEDKLVQKRVMDNVLLKFLNEYSFVSAVALDEELEDVEKALVFNQVHVGTVSEFIFEVASDEDTDERFRKSLYEMHKTYVRQIRSAGRDVDIEQHLDEDEEDGEHGNCGSCGTCDRDNAKENEDVLDVKEEEDTNMEEVSPVTPATSEKKKKGKKKKKNKDKDSSDGESETPESPEKEAENATPKSKSSKKKKKKKSAKADEDAEEDANSLETPATEANPSTSTPKPKSSKKKRKNKEIESTGDDDADNITSHVETPKPKSKKRQKSPPSVDPRSMHSPDQVISPSNSDDEAAVTAVSIAESASKRVSFGKMNHCKSYKASMKAMKTLDKDRWDTSSRTPDKGILRPKIALTAERKKKKKSKKDEGKPPLGSSSTRKKKSRKSV